MLAAHASGALQTRRKFDPRQIANLGLWLDASDASTITIATGVSQWNDKSGSGRNFAQATGSNQPALISAGQNGRNTIRGDGANDRLAASSGLDFAKNVSGVTAFAVRKWTTSPSVNKTVFTATINANSFSARFALAGGSVANKSLAGGRRTDADSFQGVSSSANIAAGFEVQCGLLDYANSDLYQYINGALDGSTTSFQTSGNTDNTNSGNFSIFATDDFSGWANVEVAEILAFRAAITTAGRQQIEGYLAHKWGLAASLPSSHPYRYAAP